MDLSEIVHRLDGDEQASNDDVDDHLEDVDDGSGCAEMWEALQEAREDE